LHQEAYADSYLQYVGTPLNFLRTIDDRQNTKSYAAFGQLTYNFTEKLALTAGLRYTHEKKKYFRTTTATTTSSVFRRSASLARSRSDQPAGALQHARRSQLRRLDALGHA
jgi:outer membrane receptor protein involved in Fe transport